MRERHTRWHKAARGLVPRDTQLYAAPMEPLAYRAAKGLVAATSIRLGQAYDQAWYDVCTSLGMQGGALHPASLGSATEAGTGRHSRSSTRGLDPAAQTCTLSEGQTARAVATSQQGGHPPETASPSSAAAPASDVCARSSVHLPPQRSGVADVRDDSEQHAQANAEAPAASQAMPTVLTRLAGLAGTAGRFIAGTVEHAFPEDASLGHDRCTPPEPPGQVQPVLSALALNRAALSTQQQHEANQIALDGSLCGLPQVHARSRVAQLSEIASACVC